jgi:hypothetical protein
VKKSEVERTNFVESVFSSDLMYYKNNQSSIEKNRIIANWLAPVCGNSIIHQFGKNRKIPFYCYSVSKTFFRIIYFVLPYLGKKFLIQIFSFIVLNFHHYPRERLVPAEN